MAYRWLILPVLALSLCIACNDDVSSGPPFGIGGAGGAGGVGGSGASAGSGGFGGRFTVPTCGTSPLCGACPTDPSCEGDAACPVGHVCIESGCTDEDDGSPIMRCALAQGGACRTDAECPSGRACVEVSGEGRRCVKTTAGCDTSFDCVVGFSCESGECVDRRVPCYVDGDCPKSHQCYMVDATRFCLRIHESCEEEFDCAGFAPRCEDIDGDGNKECAGVFDPNAPSPEPCVNSSCGGSSPVCEVGFASGVTECGQYGLCLDDEDCVSGFECVALWPDGRRECVPTGGSCAHVTDCPARQVCASPRTGGPPECQQGI